MIARKEAIKYLTTLKITTEQLQLIIGELEEEMETGAIVGEEAIEDIAQKFKWLHTCLVTGDKIIRELLKSTIKDGSSITKTTLEDLGFK